MKTRTRSAGTGFAGVRVQVALVIPQGYPCHALAVPATVNIISKFDTVDILLGYLFCSFLFIVYARLFDQEPLRLAIRARERLVASGVPAWLGLKAMA